MTSPPTLQAATQAISAARIANRLRELAAIGRVPSGGITRLALSVEERQAQDLVANWLEGLGYSCGRDRAGNLIGTPSRGGNFLVGSHLDTVPNGGAYDGALGVVAAVEAAEAIQIAGLPYLPRIVAWMGEEGPRFGRTLFGSSAALGLLTDSDWDRVDNAGITAREALSQFLREGEPQLELGTSVEGYLEAHMEQGATLAGLDVPIAVVTEIAGATHATLRVVGRADHAGTTPMPQRRDALVGAAELVLEVERIAQETPALVATVGAITVFPGAQNVVPGVVEAAIDTRSLDDLERHRLIEELSTRGRAVAGKRGLDISLAVQSDVPSATLNGDIRETLSNAIKVLLGQSEALPSWALHDAQACVLAGIPSGMIFIRSSGGSHNPAESVEPSDVALGVGALILALDALDGQRGRRMDACNSMPHARSAEMGGHAE